MTKETIRTEGMQQAAECRERAHTYEALAAEAQKRGDTRLCIEFTRKAAEEFVEASRIEGASASERHRRDGP